MTGSPASRSAPATVAGAGRRFGAPKTTRTAAPAAAPDATARATSGTPAVPAIAIAPASTTTPQSQLRRQDRESQGFPSVATAATAARKGSDGKRLDSTHVSPVTPSGICRWRDKRASSKAKSPAPAAPASATMSSRCQRRFTTSPTTTARGTARAAIWIKPSRNSRTEPGRRVTTRPTSVVTPSLVEVATAIRTASTSVAVPHRARRTTSPGCRKRRSPGGCPSSPAGGGAPSTASGTGSDRTRLMSFRPERRRRRPAAGERSPRRGRRNRRSRRDRTRSRGLVPGRPR